MVRFFFICLAGALGTGTRYLVGLWASKTLGSAFPYGTLFVNLAGCFLIAAIMRASLNTTLVSPALRPVLTTGFLGGLTTYSSFNYETTRFLEERALGIALLYGGLTLTGCLAAGWLGLSFVDRMTATR
jgi:CrcB protein